MKPDIFEPTQHFLENPSVLNNTSSYSRITMREIGRSLGISLRDKRRLSSLWHLPLHQGKDKESSFLLFPQSHLPLGGKRDIGLNSLASWLKKMYSGLQRSIHTWKFSGRSGRFDHRNSKVCQKTEQRAGLIWGQFLCARNRKILSLCYGPAPLVRPKTLARRFTAEPIGICGMPCTLQGKLSAVVLSDLAHLAEFTESKACGISH